MPDDSDAEWEFDPAVLDGPPAIEEIFGPPVVGDGFRADTLAEPPPKAPPADVQNPR